MIAFCAAVPKVMVWCNLSPSLYGEIMEFPSDSLATKDSDMAVVKGDTISPSYPPTVAIPSRPLTPATVTLMFALLNSLIAEDKSTLLFCSCTC